MTAQNDELPILVVDDDFVTLALIRKTLESSGYQVREYDSAREAWEHYNDFQWRAVLSDFYMSGMDGGEFLRRIRETDRETPFLFLTANDDLSTAVDLIKRGADDFIMKPVVQDILLFRVEHAIRDREQSRLITRIEQERELLALENRKLVSWRELYGSKDIAQTRQMIQLLSRNINQAGGFLWIDLLRSEMQETTADGRYCVSEAALDMALTAADGQRAVFEFVTFIADLEKVELNQHVIPIGTVVDTLSTHIREAEATLTEGHVRTVSYIRPSQPFEGHIMTDTEMLRRIVHELFVNAVKFSPERSRILVGFDEQQDSFSITIRNAPITTRARDRDGNPVTGIPYDFAELVFDLFYSIDAFPVELPQEEWRYGTGLYICRNLLHRMGGTISATNGVDYSGGSQQPFVQLLVKFPVRSDP